MRRHPPSWLLPLLSCLIRKVARMEEFDHQTARQTRQGGGLRPPYLLTIINGQARLPALKRHTGSRGPVFSSAAKCAWLAVAALICGIAGTAVQGQTGPSVADDRTTVTESICRQYAAALSDMPADLMFKQCMFERHCRPVPSPPGYWCEPPQPMQVKPG
jgi:hypothetical protein